MDRPMIGKLREANRQESACSNARIKVPLGVGGWGRAARPSKGIN
jgi:hypothetical protein